MLKKLRRRFITVAMAAFSVIIVLLLFIIQVSNYHNITKKQDYLIQIMLQNPAPKSPSYTIPILEYDGIFTLSLRYSLCFFTVQTNTNNEVIQIFQEPTTLISEEDAINYATHALSSTRTKGYHKQYSENAGC